MPAGALTSVHLDCPAVLGKLPGHGDFISRGVPRTLREALDQWLSDWLAQARAELGPDFVDTYETAAPWLYESTRVTAVLLPSIDAVGRHFPLLAITAPGVVIQDVYDAVVAAVAAGADGDTLRASLAALKATRRNARPAARWVLPEGAEARLPVPDHVASWHAAKGCFQ